MASGVFPVINRFYGAELLYDAHYLVKSPSELVVSTMIWGHSSNESKEKGRLDAREAVMGYDRHKVAVEIRELCEEVLGEWNAKSS